MNNPSKDLAIEENLFRFLRFSLGIDYDKADELTEIVFKEIPEDIKAHMNVENEWRTNATATR